MSEITAQMTEQNNQKQVKYIHVYNRGISHEDIFTDDTDYDTFIEYLKQYISPPPTEDEQQTTFVIRGREYTGKPHNRKNYFGKLHLIAYSLSPNHYHLLFKEEDETTHKEFMRAFGTRYSMYFNKRHKREGPLFVGSYKSKEIKNDLFIPHLTRYLHQHKKGRTNYQNHSVDKDWTSCHIAKNILGKLSGGVFKGHNGYKIFVENYQTTSQENDILKNLVIEEFVEHTPTLTESDAEKPPEIIQEPDEMYNTTPKISDTLNEWRNNIKIAEEEPDPPNKKAVKIKKDKSDSKKGIFKNPEYLFIAVTFISLLTVGLRNVKDSMEGVHLNPLISKEAMERTISRGISKISEITSKSTKTPEPMDTQEMQRAGAKTEIGEQPKVAGAKDEKGAEIVEVRFEAKVSGNLETVNVRKAPTDTAEIVLKAKNNDIFEFLSMENEWCKIKTEEGNMGYIFAEYVTIAREQK